MNLVSIGIGDSTTHSRQRQWWRRRRRHVIQVRARLRHVEPPPLVVKITPGVHVARSEALRGDERPAHALRDARHRVMLVARRLTLCASHQLVSAVTHSAVRGWRGRVARSVAPGSGDLPVFARRDARHRVRIFARGLACRPARQVLHAVAHSAVSGGRGCVAVPDADRGREDAVIAEAEFGCEIPRVARGLTRGAAQELVRAVADGAVGWG